MRLPPLVLATFCLALAGCAGIQNNTLPSQTAGALSLRGSIHGGQQPVVGAAIQLYAVGTSAPGAASTGLISSNVVTDSNGGFSISGTYTCPTAGQVYLVASGGNPGAGVNSYSVMAAALGSCASLLANASSTFINVNELTTVAAAYALAPFEGASYTAIGANTSMLPGSVGLPNAFGAAATLVSTSTGLPPGNLPTGITVPSTKLNTLADILAACVNSAGGGSGPCTQLNSVTGATNTFDAAFYIAKHPGDTSVLGLYSLATSTAPFQPTNATQPKDFTLSIRFAGTTAAPLSGPYGIAIDAAGNALVTNQTGNTITAISPVSINLVSANNNAAAAGGLSGPQGIAIDTGDFVWIANPGGNNVVELASLINSYGGNVAQFSAVNSRPIVLSSSAANPTAITTDQYQTTYTVSPAESTVYAINGGAGAVRNSLVSSSFTSASAIAISGVGTLAVGNGAGQACTLSTGLSAPVCSTQGSSSSISALAYNTFLASAGYTGVGNGSSSSAPLYGQSLGAGSTFLNAAAGSTPTAIAFDGNGTAFMTDNSALYAYNGSTALSPATGFSTLSTPEGVAVDPSGNVWTTNAGSNSVSIFIGLAAPTITPVAANLH